MRKLGDQVKEESEAQYSSHKTCKILIACAKLF